MKNKERKVIPATITNGSKQKKEDAIYHLIGGPPILDKTSLPIAILRTSRRNQQSITA